MLLLTQCAVCAIELGTGGKKCGRCQTRYCGAACQEQHWKEGGHKVLCKLIKKGGGAEAYHADKKLKEAVAEAVEACAEDTKGQTCYICTQALHWKTKEGLVRGCACRGTSGFVHVSCLAEQAKILVADANEKNYDEKRWNSCWDRWAVCNLCNQRFLGVTRYAIGWACWKTYRQRPVDNTERELAMTQLANGLHLSDRFDEAIRVYETCLAHFRRGRDDDIYTTNELVIIQNITCCVQSLPGRDDEALAMARKHYDWTMSKLGPSHHLTAGAALSLLVCLNGLGQHEEAVRFLRGILPACRAALGTKPNELDRLDFEFAEALMYSSNEKHDMREAITLIEDALSRARRIFGPKCPYLKGGEETLVNLYVKLKRLDTPLRFAVGTRVECNYGGNEDSGDDDDDSVISLGWLFDSSDSGSDYSDSDTECEWSKAVSGVVIKHHYRHPNLPTGFWAPYQVQLDSGYTIHAPLDTDRSIRAAGSD